MEGDLIESIAARIRFATGCSYSTSVEAAAISVNLLQPGHDESKARIAALEAIEAKLADCQAVIRSRGHDEGCESNWCRHCDVAMHAHTFPISHPLESRPCSESCGHDRTTKVTP